MNAREQHLATRRAAGLFDFSFMGLYEFSDASSTQRAQTRDIATLVPGQIAYTLILNEDGSVLNDATVWRFEDGRSWLFTGRRSDFERFRGSARDRSGEFAILALQGPRSGAILARLIGREAVLGLKYFRFIQKDSMVIARLGYSGELGYELLVPAAEEARLRAALLEAGRADGLLECSFEATNSLRIESGYLLFDREIDGRANPRELGLEGLVSLPHRFAMSRRLVGLAILDRPPSTDLPSAQITSECFSPTLGMQIALGFAPPEARIGDHARLAGERTARVTELPFYDPDRQRPRTAPL